MGAFAADVWDGIQVPARLILSCCIATVIALVGLWAAIVCIDTFIPSLSGLSTLLGRSFLGVGLVVFLGDLARRLWIVRSQILLEA